MKTERVHTLTDTFEAHAQQAESGVEFWLARDLQHLLGYAKWDNFLNVVSKAKTACEVSGHEVADHFADVGKMVDLGSGSQREVDDLMHPLRQIPQDAFSPHGRRSRSNPIAIFAATGQTMSVGMLRRERRTIRLRTRASETKWPPQVR